MLIQVIIYVIHFFFNLCKERDLPIPLLVANKVVGDPLVILREEDDSFNIDLPGLLVEEED
jgi:hypothetical protein